MRIGVTTRFLIKGKMEGYGMYTHEILRRLVHLHPEWEFVFIADRKLDEQFRYGLNVEFHRTWFPARRPWMYKIWLRGPLKWAMKKHNLDVLFAPDGFACLASDTPQVITIHDLNFEHLEQAVPSAEQKFHQHYMPLFAQKASRVLTVSKYSKQDIVETYGQPSEKVHAIYNGVSEEFVPAHPEDLATIREKYADGAPYFIHVGSLVKRKNLETTLRAFDKFRESQESPVKLLVVGRPLFSSYDVEQTYNHLKHKDDVVFTGSLAKDDLVQVVQGAIGLVFLSRYEGFGLPIAEAMACGVPVICSDSTSHPEVGGDAALYVDADDHLGAAELMERLINDEGFRDTAILKGREWVKRFDWEKGAKEVSAVLEHSTNS